MSAVSLLKNRNFTGLLAANTVLATAFPAQLILGGLAGLILAPDPTFATLPASVQTLAGLVVAAPVSLLMGRLGRRTGFVFGGLVTMAGALAAIQALLSASFLLLCIGHFMMGAGWATFQYFRFAAGEVVDRKWQPVAISLMLTSGLVAALLGPQIFIVARDALAPIPFAGAYASIAALAIIGLAPLTAVKLPLPDQNNSRGQNRVQALSALRRRPVRRAVTIAAASQGIMVFLMIPTPIAIVACGFTEDMASDVIRWHIVAMFAPSFVTGFLIQRFGVQTIAYIGLVTIIVAALVAALGITALHFYGALIVLGLGWNFAFIGATTMLAASVSEAERATVQGINDTIIALVATLGAFASGIVISSLGWAALALMSGGIIALALALLAVDRPRRSIT